jgi:DNA-binding transcriptional MerR regulator
MTIGELGRRLELNPRTIRYYEQIGLLPEPERSGGGYRLYGPPDEERLRFIRGAQRLGLSLGEVKETLAFRERGERPCRYVAEVLEQRLDEVERRLRELREFERELSALCERMRAPGVGDEQAAFCHYLERAPELVRGGQDGKRSGA